ncbi:TatD family deoxyribonuclease [Methylobacterium sp. C25]|uniref:Qat anti-phage system TatD family nuclease QatD n=1 Tax=Methylobacterium sp. C25 TaxID=2721622 RepID=UPI001F1CF8F9|nr:Qat anti-phage system TatD family nuclease QatD [Methylobacterium sp. C25]MCE4222122.1 TatD family deoxyribonuclease [Methylobacterium sp. C25]
MGSDGVHDFHCHLDLMADPAAEYLSRQKYRVTTLAVTTTPRAWQQNMSWADGNPWTKPALGLHPELVEQAHREVGLMLDLMSEAHFIGEIGLDGSPQHASSLDLQRRVFREIVLRAGALGGRVLSIHSRRAATQVLDEIETCPTRGGVLAVLHWFSGSASEFARAISLGCWFSVNGSMLSSARSRSMIEAIPRDVLLIESDAPLRGGKGDLRSTLSRLSELLGLPSSEIEAATDANATRLLSCAALA